MSMRRTLNDEFKEKIVETIATVLITQAEISRKYRIPAFMIGQWKKDYSTSKLFENANNICTAGLKIRIVEPESCRKTSTLKQNAKKTKGA